MESDVIRNGFAAALLMLLLAGYTQARAADRQPLEPAQPHALALERAR